MTGAKYLGPFVSSYAVQQAVDEAVKVFMLPTCNRTFSYGGSRERPCLNYYIKQCCAPCSGRLKEADYNERLNQAIDFLTKGSAKTLSLLQQQMEEAAENLEFEKAARLQGPHHATHKMSDKQKVVMSRVEEQDVVALAQGPAAPASRCSALRAAASTTGSISFWTASTSPRRPGRNSCAGITPCGTRCPPR